jgi:hypothetical protein
MNAKPCICALIPDPPVIFEPFLQDEWRSHDEGQGDEGSASLWGLHHIICRVHVWIPPWINRRESYHPVFGSEAWKHGQ